MALYLGYFRFTDSFLAAFQERARSGEPPDRTLQEKVIQLPDVLPASCRLLGAYNPLHSGAVFGSGMPPSVMIVETDNPENLAVINRHYAGYFAFNWLPGRFVGPTRADREAAMAAMAPAVAPSGVR